MFTTGCKHETSTFATGKSLTGIFVVWILAIYIATFSAQAGVALPYPQGTAFPLMMYEVEPNTTAATNTYYGWNVIQSYGATTNSTINPFLGEALTNGVSGDVVIPDDTDSNGNAVAWPQPNVETWIQSLATNTNIGWWDLPEELLPWISGQMQVLSNYTAWSRLYDPEKRPTYEYTENTMAATDIASIITNVDIVAMSCYCEAMQMPHAWVRYKVQDSGIEGAVMAGKTLGSNYLSGQKTVIADLYCATNSTGLVATPAECYHDVWSAIASGAQGIALFAYWHAIHDTPSLTNNLQQYNIAASQITGPQQIGKMILYGAANPNVTNTITSGPTRTVTFNPPGLSSGNLPPDLSSTNVSYPSLNVLCKTWSDEICIIAVNSASSTVGANITNLPVANATAVLPFETNSVTVTNGSISATFPAWGVHIYTITPSAPVFSSVTMRDGKSVLSFPGIANFSYVLQSSTNLITGQGWVNVATNTATVSGPVAFTNNITTNIKFYRLQLP